MSNGWELINEFNGTGLKVSSYRAEDAIIDFKIDFAIIFNSYESRSFEYAKLFNDNQIENAILINFQSDKAIKERNLNTNRVLLKRIVNSKVIEPEIDLNIFKYYENVNLILNLIPKEALFYGAKWFLDITGEPSIYSVALLKAFKLLFPSPELYFLNVSGVYESDRKNIHKHFSDGLSEDIYIPYYSGRPDFSKPWKYIFLLGFEGERSLSILKKCEPLSCDVIVANPGYLDDYQQQAIKSNECFLNESGFDESTVIQVDVGDVIGVFNKITEIYNSIKQEMNLCLVPLGPKPHALAAGLFGVFDDEISIMYQIPRKYYLKESTRGKYMWLYVIK